MRRLYHSIILLLLLLLPGFVQAQDETTELLGRINGLRGSLGLPGYTLNAALTAAARNQAEWMVTTGGSVSHIQDNGSTPRSRAAAAGYGSSWVGENIYIGSRASVDSAMNFWTNSAVHYRGMTSSNYKEIGIAVASNTATRAYVLVFGNPGGDAYVAPVPVARGNAGSGQQNSGPSPPSAPPPYVLGVNEQGFIMHEVQPGDTVGDVAFLYGYSWGDIPYMLSINNMTEDDVFGMEIGSVFLVPPYEGTYTPTPGEPESPQAETVQATLAPDDSDDSSEGTSTGDETTVMTLTPTASPQQTATPPGPTPLLRLQPARDNMVTLPSETITPDSEQPVATATDTSAVLLPPPATYVAPSVTPARALLIRTVPVAPPTSVAMLNTPVSTLPIASGPAGSTDASPPLWLVAAIVVQAGVLLFAALELLRRRL